MKFTLLGEHACRWTKRWKICHMSLPIALQHPIILFVCCLSTAPVSLVWVLQQATHRKGLFLGSSGIFAVCTGHASILRRIGVELTPTWYPKQPFFHGCLVKNWWFGVPGKTYCFWSCIRPNHEKLRTIGGLDEGWNLIGVTRRNTVSTFMIKV